jgi:hypothetical protein
VKIELVFAEIGDRSLSVDREHFLEFFPGAEIMVVRGGDCIGDRNDPRWGWRMNDYHKVEGLLKSGKRIAISFDADMRIVSGDVKSILDLALAFGLCMPANPRRLVKVDNEIGADGKVETARPVNFMHAVNCGIIALDTENKRAVSCVRTFLRIMKSTPMRGPVAWAKAFFVEGFHPCLLPVQWCVCGEDVGCGNEIVLHAGHDKVRKHYASVL